jgi:arylsulfatase A-like enzyme
MPHRRFAAPLLALLPALLLGPGSGCAPEAPRRPNIVLIVLDTVRADRVACGTDGRGLTPNLDALCARSIVFTHASSTSSWTLPAHASLFTGLYPLQHGATQEHTVLAGGAATLAELLGARSYRSFGVSANPVVSVKSGLARGFDEFVETWRKRRDSAFPEAADHPNQRAVAGLLGGLPADQPFFLFVNYIEAHGPNDPPEPHLSRALADGTSRALLERARGRSASAHYLDPAAISPEEFAVIGDLYDGEVAYLDALVGGLLDELEANGRLADSVVIVTSDHGENLGDHGHFRHIFSLTGSTVRVPLLIRLPGDEGAGEVRTDPVGLLDVFASVLALTGTPAPVEASGRDLFGPAPAASAAMIAEYYYPLQALGLFLRDASDVPPPQLASYLRRLRSVEVDGLRYIWSSDGRDELYDVAADPAELRNLRGDPRFAEAEARLRDRLDAFVAAAGGPRPLPAGAVTPDELGGAFEDLDPESAELLRELGYLP